MPSTIASVGNVPACSGMGPQQHLVYAPTSGTWLAFWFDSTATTSVKWAYSSDLSTWTAGGSLTMSQGHANEGRNLSVACASIAGIDVLYVAYSVVGSSNQTHILRATVGGTSLTITNADAQVGSSNNGSLGGGSYSGLGVAIDANGGTGGKVVIANGAWTAGGNAAGNEADISSNADSGTAWTAGWPGASDFGGEQGEVQSYWAAALGSGRFVTMADRAEGGTGGTTKTFFTNYFDGTAWRTGNTVPTTDSTLVDDNDWCACYRSGTEALFVKRTGTSAFISDLSTGTGATGLTWGADVALPAPGFSTATGTGLALATDGTAYWLFVLDTSNNVQVIKYTPGSGWGTWAQAIASGGTTRKYLQASQRAQAGTIGLLWTEGSASPYSLAAGSYSMGTGGGTAYTQTLTVAQATTTAFAKRAGKTLSIAQASTPLLAKQPGKLLSAAQGTTAGMARRVGKMLSTAQAGVPGFAAARLRVALLSVAQSSAATLTKQIGKPLSVAQTSAATVGRLIGKVLTVAQATMATLSAARGAQLRAVTLTVAQAAAPLMARSIGKIVGVGQVTTPLLTKQAVKALSVAQGAVVTLQTIKARFITLAVAQAASPIMARAIGKALTAPQATVSLVARRIGKTLVTGQATSALLPVIKARFITLTVAQASVASMARSVGKTLSVAQGTTTLMARAIARVLAITQAATPTLLAARVRVAALSVTQASAVALGTLRARFVVLAVTQAANTALSRAIAKTLSAVQGQAVALPKRIAKTMAVTQATTALLTTLKNAITPVIGVWAAFRSVVAALHFAAVVPALSFRSAEGRDMPMIPVDAGAGEYVLRTTDRNRLFTCDFSGNPNLGPNESIASATVVVMTWAAGAWPGATETDATTAVVVGASASPATAQVTGNVVSVLLGPGAVKGNQYRVYVEATTNAGQVITDYSPTIECDI